jgi:hypothetical protein
MFNDTPGSGGWTHYRELTPKDIEIFKEAFKNISGVEYTPTLVSTQIVMGTNYRYRTNVTTPQTSQTETWKATVDIYEPIDSTPYITQIVRG